MENWSEAMVDEAEILAEGEMLEKILANSQARRRGPGRRRVSIPSPIARRDMAVVAELRAAGATWETAGAPVGRHQNVAARWTTYYADEWRRVFAAAQERIERSLNDEARRELRSRLRSRDASVRAAAAEEVARQRLAEWALDTPPDPRVEMSALLQFLDQLTDEELNKWTQERLAKMQEPECGPDMYWI
jgi:hypothetical protein